VHELLPVADEMQKRLHRPGQVARGVHLFAGVVAVAVVNARLRRVVVLDLVRGRDVKVAVVGLLEVGSFPPVVLSIK
jgi:hypothetical protein